MLNRSGKVLKTHRYSWTLSRGFIPVGLAVLHKCDNPPCVRPRHLFLGTQKENVIDMARKGRHGMSTLTNEQISQIKNMYASGNFLQKELAHQFGVQISAISRFVNGVRCAC